MKPKEPGETKDRFPDLILLDEKKGYGILLKPGTNPEQAKQAAETFANSQITTFAELNPAFQRLADAGIVAVKGSKEQYTIETLMRECEQAITNAGYNMGQITHALNTKQKVRMIIELGKTNMP